MRRDEAVATVVLVAIVAVVTALLLASRPLPDVPMPPNQEDRVAWPTAESR